jgi:hypothetical protein
MDNERALTAYCGLYCGDCIPSHERLFEVLAELRRLADDLSLDRYAELLAKNKAAFEDYPAFESILAELAALRCPATCRDGGGRPDCSIRACAQDKGLEGCWGCDVRRGCALLEPLRGFHGDTIDGNLDAIAEHGPETWSEERGKHYPWS